MIRRYRSIRRVANSIGLAGLLLGLGASPALAAPSFGVELTRDEAVVTRSDERLDYTVKVTNTAVAGVQPKVGETMTCKPENWNNSVSFSYQWLRNGVPITGATSSTYLLSNASTTTPPTSIGDAGEAVQCRVTGTNPASQAIEVIGSGTIANGSNVVTGVATIQGTFAAGMGVKVTGIPGTGIAAGTTIASVIPAENKIVLSAAATASGSRKLFGTTPVSASAAATSLPVTVVDPQPSPAPPSGTTRPAISPESDVNYNEATAKFERVNGGVFTEPLPFVTCTAPTGWTGTGVTWSFRWLRNGVDIGSANVVETTATTSKYELQLADRFKVIQCEAIAEDANVKAVAVSSRRFVALENGPNNTASPKADYPGVTANDTSGPVSVELELPGGLQTGAHKIVATGSVAPPQGWSCEEVAASAMQPAKVICTRSDVLKAQASYPGFEVITALGADAPDLAVARATVSGGNAPTVSDEDEFTFVDAPFGLTFFDTGVFDELGNPYTQAGGHPFVGKAEFEWETKRTLGGEPLPIENFKTILTDLPRGLVGNSLAVPELCPNTADVTKCPEESIVGAIRVVFPTLTTDLPLYSIEPEFGTPAQFAFFDQTFGGLYTISTRLRPEEGYAISLDLAPSPQVPILGSTATVCSVGGTRKPNGEFGSCKEKTDLDANPKPLFTNPTRCDPDNPPVVRVKLNSWQRPESFFEAESVDTVPTGCELVPFEPAMQLDPTTKRADAPTGLDIDLTMPTDGLESQDGISQANLKRARVYFPEGMSVNATAGQGLGSCSADQVKLKTNLPISCPDSSKIGTIEIDTPILQRTLTGAMYIAKQSDAPEGALFGLYLVFESKRDGIIIKIPGGVNPDPRTGQLVVTFDDLIEDPFSSVRMHFPGGPRATLLTPPKCGTYEIKAELSSWAASDPDNPTPAETVTETSTFEVSEGPGGGPCPDGKLEAKLNAGTTDPVAGKTSPFFMRLTREEGTERFSGLEINPPLGLTAYLKGIPYCPDATLASISPDPETGQSQIDSPSCPAQSLIGTASAGAGAGTSPLYVETGKVYLAGPYKGAPLSLAVVTPAVAGPLDLGNVVIRTALYIDSKTAQITAVSDPIPTILHGILLNIRDIRVVIDRPNFTLNPTNCSEMSIGAKVQGESGSSANLSNRFQVDGCANLGFKPRISLSLKGGTKRGDNPALKAVVRPRPGDANIGAASVTLPRSAFLDQAHIRTICTRVQFAADNCPKAAIYGHAEAVTPLLDEPLKGAVYLRSSDNKLPDLVADLRGPAHQPIKIEASFRTDSIRGGIRSTLIVAPDAPVTSFTLQMQGGKKGLVVNSRDLCATTNRANAQLAGQNGRQFNSRPKVVATSCKAQRKAAKAKRKHRRQR